MGAIKNTHNKESSKHMIMEATQVLMGWGLPSKPYSLCHTTATF